MPLPRFDRLPAQTRADLLDVARKHFARDGREAASFNQIVAEAGISKTSAYHYFDGKEDLFGAVAADSSDAVLSALGPWIDVREPDALWAQLTDGTGRLLTFLAAHPDHQRVLAQADRVQLEATEIWAADLLDNARNLGMVAPMRGIDLMLVAMLGLIAALDEWALSAPQLDAAAAADALVQVLRRLWTEA